MTTARAGMIVTTILLAAAALAATFAAGCGSARRDEPLVGPVPVTDPQVRRGQQTFMQHCHQCHPLGRAGVGPALNNKPLPGALIKTQVRQGLGEMPGFSERHISPEDLDAMVRYLVALRGRG